MSRSLHKCDAEELGSRLQGLAKRIKKLHSELNTTGQDLAETIMSRVRSFLENSFELFSLLSDKSVRQRHRDIIRTIANLEEFSETTSFSSIEHLVRASSLRLEELIETARLEAQIEHQFEQAKTKAETVRSTKTVEIQDAFQDVSVSLQVLLNSEFSKPFHAKIQDVLINIQRAIENVRLLSEIQNTWELQEVMMSSFSSSSSSSSIDEETPYECVKRQINKIEKHLSLSQLSDMRFGSSLKRLRRLLEICQVETKKQIDMFRSRCPELYFVSNKTLIDLLSKSSNITNIVRVCTKNVLFSVVQDDEGAIQYVQGAKGDTLYLCKSVTTGNRHFTVWFRCLLEEIERTLRSQVDENVNIWFNANHYASVVSQYYWQGASWHSVQMAIRVFWTRLIDFVMKNEESDPQKIMKIQSRLNAMTAGAVRRLRDTRLNQVVEYMFAQNMLTECLRLDRIVRTILKKLEKQESCSFFWDSQIRHYSEELEREEQKNNNSQDEKKDEEKKDDSVEEEEQSNRKRFQSNAISTESFLSRLEEILNPPMTPPLNMKEDEQGEEEKEMKEEIKVSKTATKISAYSMRCAGQSLPVKLSSWTPLGACDRLVYTPLSERCVLEIARATGSLMGAILRDSSSFQVSRNAIERVAHLSGNRCVHFSCTEGSLVEDVTRFLRGFASCGVWGILSHAAQLSDQAKRVLISSIDSFQDATICSKNRCNIAGLGTRFQSSSRVFLAVAPSAQNISTYTRHLRSIRVERPCSRIVLKMLFRGAGVDSTVASYLSDKTCAVISQMEMLTFPGTELGEIERLRRVVKTCVEKYLLQSSTSEKKLRSILKRGGTRRSKRRRIKFAKQLYVPYRSLI